MDVADLGEKATAFGTEVDEELVDLVDAGALAILGFEEPPVTRVHVPGTDAADRYEVAAVDGGDARVDTSGAIGVAALWLGRVGIAAVAPPAARGRISVGHCRS
jgi:hypothetical protein